MKTTTPCLFSPVLLTLAFFISFSQLSGQPLCNAEFTYHHSTHNADSVSFLPVHTNYLHYSWSFGDGSHSTNVDPWHYYTSPGTYYVCLTVTDSNANGTCTDTWCDTITIGPHTGPLCNAEFTYHHSTHNADSLSFVPVHTNYLHYSWSFGDGSHSTNVDPWHYYTSPGTYYVCLTVTDSNATGTCTDTWCDSVTIVAPHIPLCNAEFTYHHSAHNADSISFIPVHTNYLHYSWSFGDGSNSTNHDPWHYYTSPGTYYVCLTVTDSNATGTCTDTWCDSVTIVPPHAPLCNAEFHYYHLTPNPDSLHFYPVVATALHYSWSFGDGTGSTDLYPWHNFAPGSYYVCLTVTDSNATGTCTNTWCDSIIIGPHAGPLCNAEFTYHHSTHNADSVGFLPVHTNYLHYYWSFGDGSHSTNVDPWHYYAPGSYYVCLTVTDSNAHGTCTDTWCDSITIGAHTGPLCNAEFTYHHSTHNADSVGFLPVHTNYLHYYWSFGDGSHSTNVDPWHYYAPGSYYVCLTVTDSNAHGTCTDTWCDSITIGPHAVPLCNAEFIYHHSTHNADSISFIPVHTNYLHYSWSFGDGSHSTNHDPWHYYTSPGTYYVCLTVTDSNATGTCSDTWCDSVTIVAPHTPVCNAEFHYYHLTHNPDSLHFYPVVATALHYSWSFGDGTGSTDLYPWHNFAPGSYYVCLTVTDSNATGTCTNTWCDSIVISTPHAPFCNAEFTFYSVTNPVSYHFIPAVNNSQTYLWDFGDGIQSTNHDPWHTYANLGNYIVCLTVTDSNSLGTCTDTWCDTVSVSHHFVNNVNLFANPASNIITVNIQNIIPPAVLMISDLQGKEVYWNNEAVNGPLVLSLNGNTSGIYFYTLIDADSNKYSGKVIMIHN